MPCRPAEYDLRKEDGERSELEVAQLVDQRNRVRRLLQEYATKPSLALPTQMQEELIRLASETPEALPPRPENATPGRYAYPEEGSWALELAFQASREEKKLCEARTLLMSIALLSPPSDEMQSAYDEQEKAHRLHRLEDLETARSYLRDHLAHLEALDDVHEDTVADVRRRLLRAEQLTVDDILVDRSELESLWPPR
jgi:hypothetical protein